MKQTRPKQPAKVRLGIDFGTTRIAVALVDRGNYPLVHFQTPDGDMKDWYPTLVAVCGDERVFGWDAWSKQSAPGWSALRSFKRLLGEGGPDAPIHLGGQPGVLYRLLIEFLEQLRRDLLERSSLNCKPETLLEVVVGVPAHANNNQRFLTLDGFRRAGFQVLGMMNEPSAAGIEYAHRYRFQGTGGGKEYVIVYDLGGGTFDVSVVEMMEREHQVVTSEGIARLGGDDFDEILARLALARVSARELSPQQRFLLLEECRERKESLHPNTRKIALDLSRVWEEAGEVILSTAEFYEMCVPLVEQTGCALESALVRLPSDDSETDWKQIAAVYLVGGASDLPIVSRTLRERYGRRVRRSPYPRAATAIGLAIASDQQAGVRVRERFTRYFGVWRESDSGARIVFDPIFAKDTPLPEPDGEPLLHRRQYHPAHNIGHLRYLECSQLLEDGRPSGQMVPWGEILFPYESSAERPSSPAEVRLLWPHAGPPPLIEEVYRCDAQGIVSVEIVNHSSGYRRSYRLRE